MNKSKTVYFPGRYLRCPVYFSLGCTKVGRLSSVPSFGPIHRTIVIDRLYSVRDLRDVLQSPLFPLLSHFGDLIHQSLDVEVLPSVVREVHLPYGTRVTSTSFILLHKSLTTLRVHPASSRTNSCHHTLFRPYRPFIKHM